MKQLLLLGLLMTLLSSTAPAGLAASHEAGATGSVAGAVVTRAGVAVPNARVLLDLTLPHGHTYSARTTSDAHGMFHFRDVPPGTGTVKAGHPRVGRGHSPVDVRAGHNSRVQVVLHP